MAHNKNDLNVRDQLTNMSPDQKDLFSKFKTLSTAGTQEQKNMAFIELIGFFKKKREGINGTSTATARDINFNI